MVFIVDYIIYFSIYNYTKLINMYVYIPASSYNFCLIQFCWSTPSTISQATCCAVTLHGFLSKTLSKHQNQRKKKTAQAAIKGLPKRFLAGAPSGTRTQDPLIKSQLLYQLS